jgi:hypothetical protein
MDAMVRSKRRIGHAEVNTQFPKGWTLIRLKSRIAIRGRTGLYRRRTALPSELFCPDAL